MGFNNLLPVWKSVQSPDARSGTLSATGRKVSKECTPRGQTFREHNTKQIDQTGGPGFQVPRCKATLESSCSLAFLLTGERGLSPEEYFTSKYFPQSTCRSRVLLRCFVLSSKNYLRCLLLALLLGHCPLDPAGDATRSPSRPLRALPPAAGPISS